MEKYGKAHILLLTLEQHHKIPRKKTFSIEFALPSILHIVFIGPVGNKTGTSDEDQGKCILKVKQ